MFFINRNMKFPLLVNQQSRAATLQFIKETLFNPWLTDCWIENQFKQIPQLRFLMEAD